MKRQLEDTQVGHMPLDEERPAEDTVASDDQPPPFSKRKPVKPPVPRLEYHPAALL